ncbi:terpene synthase family protein [Streptomyces sp. NBC_01320]|uniref:terpene synthase family protein n=1 Tax=Streptomyces sp. NBC_01320 TaxID=2903824 RepID=UPI002E163738|nr:terpene synthase family protein [Streptomyces sp. NBC_01320]
MSAYPPQQAQTSPWQSADLWQGTTYRLPRLLHQLPVAHHRDHQSIGELSRQWGRRHLAAHFAQNTAHSRTIARRDDMDTYIAWNLPWGMCLCYPHGEAARLVTVCNFIDVVTIYDDVSSTPPDGGSPQPAAQTEKINRILRGHRPQDSFPLGQALHDVWQDFTATAPTGLLQRLTQAMHDVLEGITEETAIRKSDNVPDLQTLLRLRRGPIYADVCLLLLEYVLNIELPPEFLTDPRVTEVHNRWADSFFMLNDILSLAKEIRDGDWSLNTVAAIGAAHQLDLQEAVNETARLIELNESAFTKARDELLASDLGRIPHAATYLTELDYLISASAAFQGHCSRYYQRSTDWDPTRPAMVTLNPECLEITGLPA